MHSILIASKKFAENKLFVFQSESETQRIKKKIKKKKSHFFQVCPLNLILVDSKIKQS
jgi:hypothetical protein